MAKCKHMNADHLKAGDFFPDDDEACFGPYKALVEQFRCLDCGAWLPLGPAADAPSDPALAEAMAVEIRAAEIAADWDAIMDMRSIVLSPMESLGACSPDGQHIDLCRSILDEPGQRAAYLAGWLACEIVNCDAEQP